MGTLATTVLPVTVPTTTLAITVTTVPTTTPAITVTRVPTTTPAITVTRVPTTTLAITVTRVPTRTNGDHYVAHLAAFAVKFVVPPTTEAPQVSKSKVFPHIKSEHLR